MDRELVEARNTGCKDCDLAAITRKWDDIATGREEAERTRNSRRTRFGSRYGP